jgi:hypothetical protein
MNEWKGRGTTEKYTGQIKYYFEECRLLGCGAV